MGIIQAVWRSLFLCNPLNYKKSVGGFAFMYSISLLLFPHRFAVDKSHNFRWCGIRFWHATRSMLIFHDCFKSIRTPYWSFGFSAHQQSWDTMAAALWLESIFEYIVRNATEIHWINSQSFRSHNYSPTYSYFSSVCQSTVYSDWLTNVTNWLLSIWRHLVAVLKISLQLFTPKPNIFVVNGFNWTWIMQMIWKFSLFRTMSTWYFRSPCPFSYTFRPFDARWHH